MSSISCNNATTAWIHWNAAALDNLSNLTFVWIGRFDGAGSANETIVSKSSGAGSGSFILRRRASPNDTTLEVLRDGATDETIITNASTVTTETWYWIGYRGSMGTSPELYVGTPHTRPTEVGYASRTSGLVLVDTTTDWEVGRLYGPTNSLRGPTAFVGIAGATMSAKELLSHWPIPRKGPGTAWLRYSWTGIYSAKTAIDWSGNRSDGTVHGSTLLTGPPVPSPIVGVGLAA